MKFKVLLPVFAVAALASAALAQLPQHRDVSDLQPYKLQQHVSGTIRVYGNNYIPKLMKRWQEGFRRFQPGVAVHYESSRHRSRNGRYHLGHR